VPVGPIVSEEGEGGGGGGEEPMEVVVDGIAFGPRPGLVLLLTTHGEGAGVLVVVVAASRLLSF